MNYQRSDMFYDNPPSHSPNSQRLPQGIQAPSLHHLTATFANSIAGFYPTDDQSARFEVPRFNDRMTAATMHGNYGGYDLGAQSWNHNAFGHNAMNTLGGTNRMKSSSRGRSALPSVSAFNVVTYDIG